MTDALPHENYVDAVFEALDKFGLHPKDAMTTTPDGEQLDGVVSFLHSEFPDDWPDGVHLSWDQHEGWSLCSEGTNRSLYPLDLETYAAPTAVADRARTRLLGLPDMPSPEAWDGAATLQSAVEAWETDSR